MYDPDTPLDLGFFGAATAAQLQQEYLDNLHRDFMLLDSEEEQKQEDSKM